jgi:hypothetical protein
MNRGLQAYAVTTRGIATEQVGSSIEASALYSEAVGLNLSWYMTIMTQILCSFMVLVIPSI